jgi:hypothetical protein
MDIREAPSSSAPKSKRGGSMWWLSLVCLVLAYGLYQGRRSFIATFFAVGPATVTQQAPQALEEAATHPVRVVLLDGLGIDTASTLPQLSKLCSRGREFEVDTGFPTVSLPVQHSLWTGLTQSQAGVKFVIERLETPPTSSLPAALPDSIAVAESHVDIITSFGFAETLPVNEEAVDHEWRDQGFFDESLAALGSDRALAFVHVLRIDEVGHLAGAASPAYLEAAQQSDAWLEPWVAAAPQARWLILADHGHRAEGGHGGRLDRIPRVRACLFGPGIEAAPRQGPIHLVDLARELFRWSGYAPTAAHLGRPLDSAVSEYVEGEHTPSPEPLKWLLAALWVCAGLWGSFRRGEGPWPWWLPAAYLGFVTLVEVPSLSLPAVYPPVGRDLLVYGGLGWVVLLISLTLSKAEALPTVIRQLAFPLALMGAAYTLCWDQPPLLLHVTAHASVLTSWCAAACLGTGLWLAGQSLAKARAQSSEG